MIYIHQLRDRTKHLINLARAKKNLKHFHKIHRKAAFSNIQKIEIQNGQKLTPQMKKLSDEYANEVFGEKNYAPWLYFYSAFRGKFMEGWIPANFYARYVVPDKGLFGVAVTKTFSKVVLNTETLPDIAYHIYGHLYDKVFSPISLSELKQIIGKGSDVFLKINQSVRGMGITKVNEEAINEQTFRTIGNCVIQFAVKQHQLFDEIVTGPLSTIRITTVRNPQGKIEFRGSHLKLGLQGNKWYKFNEGILVPVISDDGQLDSCGYAANFQRLTKHPDSNYSFSNTYIPRFRDAVEICVKLHSSIPHFPIVGWDVTVDYDEKVKVIEWNAGMPHPGIKFDEGTIGPCFTGLNWESLKKD